MLSSEGSAFQEETFASNSLATHQTSASDLLPATADDRPPPASAPLGIPLSTNASELIARADIAWRAMVKMHALELLRSDRFVRTGQLTAGQVHQLAKDHLALGRAADDFDATVQAVLDRADALEVWAARGVEWWNKLTESDRADWLRKAGSAVPADAWEAFRKTQQ